MVVLVRCNDETCSVALESCLEGLVKGGLIKAWLDKEEWVSVPGVVHSKIPAARRKIPVRIATVSA